MRQVKTTLTASPSLPSIFDLARMGGQCAAEADRLDTMPTEHWGTAPMARDRQQSAVATAWARKAGLDDLIAALPAETAQDAVALLVQAHMIADGMGGDDDVKRLLSILQNVIPTLASAAGVDLAEIAGEHIPPRRDAMFGPPPAGA